MRFLMEPQLRGGELYKYQEREERLKALKMLVVWWWAPKNAKEVTERFIQWKQKGKYEFLYPISTHSGPIYAHSSSYRLWIHVML